MGVVVDLGFEGVPVFDQLDHHRQRDQRREKENSDFLLG